MYVYKITNLINGKIYVGKQVRPNDNYFGSGKLIKKAIKKYGIMNFEKTIIEICESHEELCNREKFWIKELKSQEVGYNITEGGTGGDTLTNHPNKIEIIKKRQLSNTGKKRSPEFCELMSRISRSIDSETRKKTGEAGSITKKKRWKESGYTEKEKDGRRKAADKLILYNKSEKGRKAVSDRLKGKPKPPFTEEHRRNIGKASKGRPGVGKRAVIICEVRYESLHKASELLNMPITTIRARLLNPKFKEWNYESADPSERLTTGQLLT